MPTAKREKPPSKLRQALLLLAQDERETKSPLSTEPLRAIMDEICRRERKSIPEVAAWLRGQLADPDPPPAPAQLRQLTEEDVRAIVRDELAH